MTSLYALAAEYCTAADRLHDLDLDPQTIADTLEGMAGEIELKAKNIGYVIRNCEALAAQIKEAEDAMAARRSALQKRAEHIRNYLLTNMQACGISKIECPEFRLAVRDNPAAVVIDAEGQLPDEFMVFPVVVPRPDKKAIGAAIKTGRDVPGAHLEVSQRLEIR